MAEGIRQKAWDGFTAAWDQKIGQKICLFTTE
jgi:hypothetical protein